MRRHHYPGLFGDPRTRGLRTAIGVSLIVHLALLLSVGKLRVHPPERTFFAPVHMVDLIEPSAKKVGKPAAAKAPAAPPKPTPTAPPPPKPQPQASPKPQPKPAPSPPAIEAAAKEPPPPPPERTEADVRAAIERMRQETPPPEPVPAAPSTPAPAAGTEQANYQRIMESFRQRVGAPAPSASGPNRGGEKVGVRGGSTNALQQVRLRAYYNQLWDHVTSHWAIPPSLQGKDFAVIVSVVIDRDGGIVRSWVEEPSASSAFDQSALRALERAAPLPPIPDSVPGDTLEIGFRFHPD